MAISSKKTFYYNFYPTKSEEQDEAQNGGSSSSSNGEKPVRRVLIEIPDLKDYQPPPPVVHNNPRRIIKVVSANEIMMGMLFLSFNDTFEHVFRYWPLDEVNFVLNGYIRFVTVCDVTDYPSFDQSDRSIYFQMGQTDGYYILACMDVIRERCLKIGDEIGLAWDNGRFLLKLLSRSKRVPANNAIRLG